MTTHSQDIKFELELESNDFEITEVDINVEYEIIKAQPDVGINDDYAEITGLSFCDDEYNKDLMAVIELKSDNSVSWIGQKLFEGGL